MPENIKGITISVEIITPSVKRGIINVMRMEKYMKPNNDNPDVYSCFVEEVRKECYLGYQGKRYCAQCVHADHTCEVQNKELNDNIPDYNFTWVKERIKGFDVARYTITGRHKRVPQNIKCLTMVTAGDVPPSDRVSFVYYPCEFEKAKVSRVPVRETPKEIKRRGSFKK